MFPIATTPTMETKFDIKVEANTIAGQELAIIEAGFSYTGTVTAV